MLDLCMLKGSCQLFGTEIFLLPYAEMTMIIGPDRVESEMIIQNMVSVDGTAHYRDVTC